MARGELSLDQSNPAYGDTITFTVSVPDNAESPALQLACYQDGVIVFAAGGYPLQTEFTLGPSSAWQGGAAEAEAVLQDFGRDGSKRKPLAPSVKFHVEA